MPYVNIKVTREGGQGLTRDEKLALIKGSTELLQRVLNKDPASTFVIVDEIDTDNWGLASDNITNLRAREAAARARAGTTK